MPRRHREHDLVLEERLEAHSATPGRRADHTQLELPAGDRVDDVLRVVDRERDRDAGIRLLKLAEQERKHRGARPGRAADLEPTRELALPLARDLLEERLFEREQPLRTPVEPLSRLGRLDPAPRAIEQPLPEALLERANLEADRRLRYAQLLGRLREAASVDDGAEGRQLAGIHKESLCI